MSIPNFPSTGLVPNVTTFQVGDILYMWDGEKWKSITAPLKADQITWKDGKTAGYALDDLDGFTDALFAEAGIVDDGQPDKLGASQRMDAMRVIFSSVGTVADVAAGKFKVGARVSVTDRDGGIFLIESGSSASEPIYDGYNWLPAGAGKVAKLQSKSVIRLAQFGVVADFTVYEAPYTDNSGPLLAVEKFINSDNPNYSFIVVYPSGHVATSSQLTFQGGGTYGGRKVTHMAEGRCDIYKVGTGFTNPLNSVIYLKQPVFAGSYACSNVEIKNISVNSKTAMYGVASNDFCNYIQTDNLNMYIELEGSIGYYFYNPVYLSSFTNAIIDAESLAWKNVIAGTSNWWDGLFASACNDGAFHINSIYSSAGALAADNCGGDLYKLTGDMSIGSLGCESIDAKRMVVSTFGGSSIVVDTVYVQNMGFSPTVVDCSLLVAEAKSSLQVGGIKTYVGSETITVAPQLRLASVEGDRASIKVSSISGFYRFGLNDVISSSGTLNIPLADGTLVNVSDKRIVSCGAGRDFNVNWLQNGNNSVKRIYLNHGVNPRTLQDTTDVTFTSAGIKSGDLILTDNVLAGGLVGWSVTVSGADFNSAQYAVIPTEVTVSTIASLPTASLRTGRKVNVTDIRKTLTYYATGVVGWYDESGTKLA